MKQLFTGIIVILLLLLSCCGEKDPANAGTVTLTNELYGTQLYYSNGLYFKTGRVISSLSDPEPDLTVEAGVPEGSTEVEAFLSGNTLEPPFSLIGTYGTESEAKTAFRALTSFGTITYKYFGNPLAANQIWIMRTRDETYAKIRIIDVELDTDQEPDFASCTFEWAYQPDGTKTFPSN